jgi:glucosamine kinase
MNNKVILGLETGGTYTRAAITDTNGNLLSYVKWQGGGNPYMEPKAKENIFNAIDEAAQKANCALGDIIAMAGGMGGYDYENDKKWVEELTSIEGLDCPKQYMTDVVAAQKGAFILKPGIIAVSGTGSLTVGITETGRKIDNYYNFGWYENTSAKGLAYNCVYKIIAGETDETDIDFINIAFRHFGVNGLPALIDLGVKGFMDDGIECNKHFGNLAPMVTEAALNGSRLAESICNRAARDIVTSIKLVGSCFESESVLTVLAGSVANSTFIKKRVTQILNEEKSNRKYMLVEPSLPPVLGAVIMAMQLVEIELSDQILNNLYKGAETI